MEYLTGSSWNGDAFLQRLTRTAKVFRTSIINLPHLQANCRFGTAGETLEPGAERHSTNWSIRPGDLRHQQRIPCPCMQPCLSQSVGSGDHNEVGLSSPSFAQKLMLLVIKLNSGYSCHLNQICASRDAISASLLLPSKRGTLRLWQQGILHLLYYAKTRSHKRRWLDLQQ